MGGFTGLFDRPDPTVARLTKNPSLQPQIDALGNDAAAASAQGRGGLANYIRDYIGGNAAAKTNTAQETGVLDSFYNGTMATNLASMRARQEAATKAAADYGAARAVAGANRSMVGADGAGGSYRDRALTAATMPYYVKAAQDNAAQQRADTDYLTGNQLALAGGRTRLADTLASRDLQPYQMESGMVRQNAQTLAPVISEDQANNFYGIKQKPGLLDRMQQEVQFLQGLQSIMKEQYGTAGEVAGGWSGMAGGGGGGGGMGGMMGGMGGMMRRGGLVRVNYDRGGGVHGPGTGTSDSIPAQLSDGEFVVPASAVKIPGVLPWLEKIRKAGLVHEAHVQHMTGMPMDGVRHMADGGAILYADSFGGLGNQALQRDMFNEAVVSAGGSTGQYANSQQIADKSMQQQADATLLNYLRSKQDGQGGTATGGGYPYRGMGQPTDYENAAYGPSTGGIPATYARGGMVRHMAGGGPIWMGGNDSSSMLHNLAQEEYRRYMAGGMQPRVSPQATAEQYAIARDYSSRGELGPENIHLFSGLHPSTTALLLDQSLRQRPAIEQEYDIGNSIASKLNDKAKLDADIKELTDQVSKGTHLLGNDEGVNQAKATLDELTKQQKDWKNPTANDKRLQALVIQGPGGVYQSVRQMPAWRTRNALSQSGTTGTSGGQTPQVQAPLGWTPTPGGEWERPTRPGEGLVQPDVQPPLVRGGNITDAVQRLMQPPIDVQANVQPLDYEAAAYGPATAGMVRLPRQQVAKMYGESRFGRIPPEVARSRQMPEAIDYEAGQYDQAPIAVPQWPANAQDVMLQPVNTMRPQPSAVPNTRGAMVTDFSNSTPATYGRGGAPGATLVTARAPNIWSMQSPKSAGTNSMVKMLSTDGRVWDVPATNVPIAIRRGATVIQ